MSAKSLNRVDHAYRSKPETVAFAACGRMAKRHMRSVHREACRPQGVRSPQRQFSPVKSVEAGDDGVNVSGSQYRAGRSGETGESLPGFEVVACMQRSVLELGRPARLPDSGRLDQLTGDPPDG